MRRLLVLAAALVLVAGCGGGGSKEEAEVSGPVSITIWHSETASAETNLVKLVDEFNASQDQVKVDIIYQGDDAALTLKLIAGLPSNVPTVAYMSEPFTQTMIDSQQVVPIQQFADRDGYDFADFYPASLAYYTIGDTLYAIPYALAVPLMYYNKIPFREAGLDPEKPPRDLEEAFTMSQALQQRDASGSITRYGFAMDVQPWYLEVMMAGAGELYVNNDNGREAPATAVAFDNEAGREFFRWWHDMEKAGLLVDVGRNPSGAESLLAIGAGRAVMTYSTSAALRSIFDVLEREGVEGMELGAAPVPGIPGAVPEGSPGVYSRSLWIMQGRPKAEQEAGWTFIKWLLQPDRQAEWFAGSGYLPVRQSAYDYPAAKDVVARYPEFQLPVDLFAKTATTSAALGPLLGPFQGVRDAVSNAIESMVAGDTNGDDAIAAGARDANKAIAEYNDRLNR